jgi:hypothetical protein
MIFGIHFDLLYFGGAVIFAVTEGPEQSWFPNICSAPIIEDQGLEPVNRAELNESAPERFVRCAAQPRA